MTDIKLYNKDDDYVTTVRIPDSSHPDAVLWGSRFFVLEIRQGVDRICGIEAHVWISLEEPR